MVWTVRADRDGNVGEPVVVAHQLSTAIITRVQSGSWLRFYREPERVETEVIARDAEHAIAVIRRRCEFARQHRLWGRTIGKPPRGYPTKAEEL